MFSPEGYTEPSGDTALATGPWEKYFDDDSASYFYFNNVTQESVFERPEEYLSPRPTAYDSAAAATASAQVQSYWEESGAATGQPQVENSQLLESGQNNWQKYWDDDQQEFLYYNTATNESTFDRPRTYYTPRVETGAGNWAKYLDETTQEEFYYNTETGVSQFERPINFVTPRDTY